MDARVGSLLVATAAQLMVVTAIVNAYGAPIPATAAPAAGAAGHATTPQAGGGSSNSRQQKADQQRAEQQSAAPPMPRVRPIDFGQVEAHHVRAFFSTPPPVQLAQLSAGGVGSGSKGGAAAAGGPAVPIQQMPIATMAALPGVLVSILGSLCGVEEAMAAEVLASDGVVDRSATARVASAMLSTADRLAACAAADVSGAGASAFKPKCPAVEVPLLWVPPAPPAAAATGAAAAEQSPQPPAIAAPPPRAGPSRPASKPTAGAAGGRAQPQQQQSATAAASSAAGALSTAVALSTAGSASLQQPPLPPMGSTAYRLGTAVHHDGCSVFKVQIDPFPSAVVTSAVVSEGIRSAMIEMSKVRAATRVTPAAAPTAAAGSKRDNAYTTLLEAPHATSSGVNGGFSAAARDTAKVMAAPANSVCELLTAAVGTAGPAVASASAAHGGGGGGGGVQLLEVVDTERNNLRLLNRALAETRVRLAAEERQSAAVAARQQQQQLSDEAADGQPNGGGGNGGAPAAAAARTSPQRGGAGGAPTGGGAAAKKAAGGRAASVQRGAGADADGTNGGQQQAADGGVGMSDADVALLMAKGGGAAASLLRESIADERRGADVLRRTDPLPRRVLPGAGGQPCYIYVEDRPDVAAQNKAEGAVVRAVLEAADRGVSPSRKERGCGKSKGGLAKQFVGAFFNKTFGGSVSAAASTLSSAAEKGSGKKAQLTASADPSGLVDDRTATSSRPPADAYAAQKRRVETVMLLRNVAKAAAALPPPPLADADGSFPVAEMPVAAAERARGGAYLTQLARAAIDADGGNVLGAAAASLAVETDAGGDDTGAIELLASANNNGTNGINGSANGSSLLAAPPVGSSAHVAAWIDKALTPTEQQFLLDQAALMSLAKSTYPSLTPLFSTNCHAMAEDLPPSRRLPAAAADRAADLFALFPSNLKVAATGRRLARAIAADGGAGGGFDDGDDDCITPQPFVRNSRLLATAGYFSVGITPHSNACPQQQQQLLQQKGSAAHPLSSSLDSHERHRISRWAFAAAVGARPQFQFTAAALSRAVAAYAAGSSGVSQQGPQSASLSPRGSPSVQQHQMAGGAFGGTMAGSGYGHPMGRAASASPPIPTLRDEDGDGGAVPPAAAHLNPNNRQKAAVPFLLPPTTAASPFSAGADASSLSGGQAIGVGGRRVARGQRTLVLPYDGSIVEATAPVGGASTSLGGGGNAATIKYHRSDVTVVGHYITGRGGRVVSSSVPQKGGNAPLRIVATFNDDASSSLSNDAAFAGRPPLVTLEGDSMTITDRSADERLAAVTRVNGVAGAEGRCSRPSLTFASISTEVSGAASGALLGAAAASVGNGRGQSNSADAAPQALAELGRSLTRERAPLVTIAHQLAAVTSAAATALQTAGGPPSTPVAASPAARRGGAKGAGAGGQQQSGTVSGAVSRTNSPASGGSPSLMLSTAGTAAQSSPLSAASASETAVEKALLTAAAAAATRVVEAACSGLAKRTAAAARRGASAAARAPPALPPYQRHLLAINAAGVSPATDAATGAEAAIGGGAPRSHNRPAPTPITGYSARFERPTEGSNSDATTNNGNTNGGLSLVVGLRTIADVEQSRDVCSSSGVVTVYYVSGSIVKLFPDGATATLLSCPADAAHATAYYTAVDPSAAATVAGNPSPAYVLAPAPLHPTLLPEGWTLEGAHTAARRGVSHASLRAAASAAAAAGAAQSGDGQPPPPANGRAARPPSPNTSRGMAPKVAAGATAGRGGKGAGAAADGAANRNNNGGGDAIAARPPSATLLRASEGAAQHASWSLQQCPPVLGPIPIAIPKYWLLTAPSGARCARRCGGTVLDEPLSAFPQTAEWLAMRSRCEAHLPAVVTAAGPSSGSSSSVPLVAPLPPLDAAASFDAQNVCHVVSRADGVVTAHYNAPRPGAHPHPPHGGPSPNASPLRGSAQAELEAITQRGGGVAPQPPRDTAGKGSIRVAIHADGTTIVGVQPTAQTVPSAFANYVPIPTHLPALDGFIHFLAGHAADKCGGDITTIWPESLGLGHRERDSTTVAGGVFSTSLAFLIEHPRFPRVILRRNAAPTTTVASSASAVPFDTFAVFSDQTLLACELVTVRTPATNHARPAGYTVTPGTDAVSGTAPQLPFFHTRLVRPTGTTLRVMNATAFVPAAGPTNNGSAAANSKRGSPTASSSSTSVVGASAAPVLVVEPAHVAVGLTSPYRQLLVAAATAVLQSRTNTLGNVPTSLSGKARHLATIATSAALHEACPVFALSVPNGNKGRGADASSNSSDDGAVLMRLIDCRNFVTTVAAKGLAVGFARHNTERLLMRLAPQGLATHAVSKRRQEEEARQRAAAGPAAAAAAAAALGRDAIGALESALRTVARSFVVKYALIGTPQIGVFHRGAREGGMHPPVAGGGGSAAAGATASAADGAASTAPPPSTTVSRATVGGAESVVGMTLGGGPGRAGRENPAYLSDRDAAESLRALGYDYAPLLFTARDNSRDPNAPLLFSQLLTANDLAPFIRQTMARSNAGPAASDLTATPNEEDDLTERCLAIFPSDAAGPILSTVVTAGRSTVSGEPHIEQLQFYDTLRVPSTLKGGGPHADPLMFGPSGPPAAPPLHRPHQGICPWLPKTALPPKRLLLAEGMGISAGGGGVAVGGVGADAFGTHFSAADATAVGSSSAGAAAALEASMAMESARLARGGTLNVLGHGHSSHATYASRALLKFGRYSAVVRDAVAAVRLAAEAQRQSMVHYTSGVVAHARREEERGLAGGAAGLKVRYARQLEAVARGADPSLVCATTGEVVDRHQLYASHANVGEGAVPAEDVMVLTLEGGADSPIGSGYASGAEAGEYEDQQQQQAATPPRTSTIASPRSTNTARERAVVYLNQRSQRPLCEAVISCDPFPSASFGALPVPVFDDRTPPTDGSAMPPMDPLYPFKYALRGTIHNKTNDTVLLVIRNPPRKVDDRTGERRLVSAVSVTEGGNMRLGPNGSAPFTLQLETTTNEMVRRSLSDAVQQIAAQEALRLEAVAAAEAEGTTPPAPRRFVMDLIERLRIDVVGAAEPLVLTVKASFVLNASLKDATVPRPNVIIKTPYQ